MTKITVKEAKSPTYIITLELSRIELAALRKVCGYHNRRSNNPNPALWYKLSEAIDPMISFGVVNNEFRIEKSNGSFNIYER